MDVEIRIDRDRRITGHLIDDEHCGFRSGRGCVDKILILKQLGEKTRGGGG